MPLRPGRAPARSGAARPKKAQMEKQEKPMGKSLSSDSARARSQKQQKEAWRHAAPCSAGRAGAHPGAERLGLYRFRGSHLSHLVGAGMRGYDLPTIVKLLEVHGGITDYLLLGTWERDRPPGESQCEVWLK